MDEAEVGRFGSLFSEFLERVVYTARSAPGGAEPLVDRIESFLGADPLGLPVVSEKFRPSSTPPSGWPSTTCLCRRTS
jgi:hypothetical protein